MTATELELQLLDQLEATLPGTGRLTVGALSGGTSNAMYVLERGGDRFVLRMQPTRVRAPGANDVHREARVLQAIRGTDIPHAEVVAVGTDGTSGRDYYVMPFRDGLSIRSGLPSQFESAQDRYAIAQSLIETLVAIHAVSAEDPAVDGLGRPEGFVERQVERWMSQLDRYRVRPLAELDEVARWLRARTPRPQSATLIHGDFGLHNLLIAPDRPPRVLAVLDWETATLGDPLIDLGHFLCGWLQGDEHARWFGARVELDLDGFPGRAELCDWYAGETGRDLGSLDWFRALARLRIAVILEGAYARYVADPDSYSAYASLAHRIPNIAEHALAITRGEA